MKKLLAFLCAITLVLTLASCKSKTKDDGDTNDEKTSALNEMSLSDIMTELYKNVDDVPKTIYTTLDKDNFEAFSFVEYKEDYEGLASEAAIGSIAHSVVLVRVPDEKDAKSVAEKIEKNANPRKWICVEAEKTGVMTSGNTILLVMSFTETTDAILGNFGDISGEKVPEGTVNNADAAFPELEPTPEGNAAADPENDPNAVTDSAENSDNAVATPIAPETSVSTPSAGTSGNTSSSKPGNQPAPQPQTPTVQTPVAEAPSVPVVNTPAAEAPSAPVVETPSAPAADNTPAVEAPAPPAAETDLPAAMKKILNNVGDLPKVGNIELDADNFKYYAFTDYQTGYRGICSEALIGSIAHSVVLVEVPEGANASSVADSMKKNANPRKWICVEAEDVQSASNGRLALLVMSFEGTTDNIIKNFKAL